MFSFVHPYSRFFGEATGTGYDYVRHLDKVLLIYEVFTPSIEKMATGFHGGQRTRQQLFDLSASSFHE